MNVALLLKKEKKIKIYVQEVTEIKSGLNLPRPLCELFQNRRPCQNPIDLLNKNLKGREALGPHVSKSSLGVSDASHRPEGYLFS